jgi:hypothetical protein
VDRLEAIDAFLIATLERFCHWTQRSFGLTSVTWERWALLIAAVYITGDWRADSYFVRWLDALILSQRIVGFIATYWKRSGRAVMNGKKITDFKYRITFLAISALTLPYVIWEYGWRGSYWFEFVTLSYYLSACDDLPWSESKVKQVWRSLTSPFSRAEARVKAGSPA